MRCKDRSLDTMSFVSTPLNFSLGFLCKLSVFWFISTSTPLRCQKDLAQGNKTRDPRHDPSEVLSPGPMAEVQNSVDDCTSAHKLPSVSQTSECCGD